MFYDFITNTLIFFEKKKAFHIFFHTNIGEFLMLTIEILTKRELTTSLVLNNRTQEDSATDWKNLYLNIKVNEYTFRKEFPLFHFAKLCTILAFLSAIGLKKMNCASIANSIL